MASYPAGVYSPRTKANKSGVVYDAAQTKKIYAEDITKLDDEVVAIETELGANPKGIYASVAANLAALWSAISSFVTSFIELSDAPSSYTDQAGKVVAVNAEEDGLEFITAGGGVKCTGAEINTGTDDAKFATPKAIADSDIAFLSDIPDLASHEALTNAHNIRYAFKTADETVNNSNVLQNDNDLVLSLEANKIYTFELHLVVAMKANSDFKHAFTQPAGVTSYMTRYSDSSTTVAATATTTWSSLISSSNNIYIKFLGIIITTGTTGDFQLQWAQNTAVAEDTKVLKGSYLKLTKLN